MTLATFFEKFDLFAEAPNAVAKMRELILDLAVKGRLVRQDPNDESAEALNSKLPNQLQAIADKVGVRSSTPTIRIERCDNLPTGWGLAAIQSIGVTQTGTTPSKSESSFVGHAIPFIKPGDIHGDEIDYENEGLSLDGLAAGRLIPRNSVLMVSIGGSIGKTAMVDRDVSCNQQINSVSPAGCIEPRFVLAAVRSSNFQTEVRNRAAQGTLPIISKGKWETIQIPLPPLAEQRRIVAKVDELMALCDRLEVQQQERESCACGIARASLARFADSPTPANLNLLFHKSYSIPPADLRKAILSLAVQGKLVPQDPSDEPAEEIVRRIEAERLSLDSYEFGEPVNEADLTWSLPLLWKWVRLGDIANIKHGYAFASESFTTEPTRYVLTTPGNFYESGGFRDRGANTKYFKGEVPPSFVFDAGDLIIPMTEQAAGLLGSPAFIPDDGKIYLHNQRLGKLQFYSDEVAPEFVFWFFNSEFFRGELARTCTGMKVRHTSPKRILKVPFPLCPLAEQRRIVAKLDKLMTLVDQLETQLTASRATADRLLEAVVTELAP